MISLQKTIHVPLPPSEAFDLFLRRIDSWWPKDSHAPLGPDARLRVEPHNGGTITEIGPDGTENLWGRIIGYQPDSFIAFTWFPDAPEDEAVVVAVSFHATDHGTRLELTQGSDSILGTPVDAVSTSYLFAWDLVLGSYAFVAHKEPVDA